MGLGQRSLQAYLFNWRNFSLNATLENYVHAHDIYTTAENTQQLLGDTALHRAALQCHNDTHAQQKADHKKETWVCVNQQMESVFFNWVIIQAQVIFIYFISHNVIKVQFKDS